MVTEETLVKILEIQNEMMVNIYGLAEGVGINWNKFSETSQKIDDLIAEIRKSSGRR